MTSSARGNLLSPALRWVLLAVYLLFTLSPIVWLFLSTIQTQASLLRVPPHLLPQEITFANYVNIFKPAAFGENSGQSTFFLALRNSVLVALGTTAIAMTLGTLGAYAIARFNIPGRRWLLLLVLGTQLLPAISIIIPLFRMFKMTSLLDTIFALILAYSTFSIPFVVWIMAGYFQSVPAELEEAARIDGASRFQSFIRIALPLAAPGPGGHRHLYAAQLVGRVLLCPRLHVHLCRQDRACGNCGIHRPAQRGLGHAGDRRLHRQPAAAHHLAGLLPLHRVRPGGRRH